MATKDTKATTTIDAIYESMYHVKSILEAMQKAGLAHASYTFHISPDHAQIVISGVRQPEAAETAPNDIPDWGNATAEQVLDTLLEGQQEQA